MGVGRLLRCQPFCEAGFDPVPEQFFWLGSRVQEANSESTDTDEKNTCDTKLTEPKK